jgi:pyruvate formate lyase activating enzyme
MKSCTLCGKCALYCPNDAREICGKEYDISYVLGEIKKDISYYKVSGGGVTFSGGECMLQIDFLEEILIKCKSEGIHTAVDTAGHVPYEFFERILPYTDLFLYDIKCYDSQKHKTYTGVENTLILSNLKKLLSTDKKIWIRIPVIPSVNDSTEEMHMIKKLLVPTDNLEKIELLPYHSMGVHKYGALKIKATSFDIPDQTKIKELDSVFDILRNN